MLKKLFLPLIVVMFSSPVIANSCTIGGQTFTNLTASEVKKMQAIGGTCGLEENLKYGIEGWIEIDGEKLSLLELMTQNYWSEKYANKEVTLVGYVLMYDVIESGRLVHSYQINATIFHASQDQSSSPFPNPALGAEPSFMITTVFSPLDYKEPATREKYQKEKTDLVKTLSRSKGSKALVKVRGKIIPNGMLADSIEIVAMR